MLETPARGEVESFIRWLEQIVPEMQKDALMHLQGNYQPDMREHANYEMGRVRGLADFLARLKMIAAKMS